MLRVRRVTQLHGSYIWIIIDERIFVKSRVAYSTQHIRHFALSATSIFMCVYIYIYTYVYSSLALACIPSRVFLADALP